MPGQGLPQAVDVAEVGQKDRVRLGAGDVKSVAERVDVLSDGVDDLDGVFDVQRRR